MSNGTQQGTEPQGTEPQGTEPQGTEPQGTEPQGTEPQGTEPQGTEPQGTEQNSNTDSQGQSQNDANSDARQGESEREVQSAADYKLPEGVPEELKGWAFENGLSQKQLDASISQMNDIMQKTSLTQAQELRQQGEQHLEKWGNEAKYNLNLAKKALQQNDPDGSLKKALDTSGYGNHPAVLEFLYQVGRSMKEGGFLKSDVKVPQGEKSAAQTLFGNNHPSAS